MKFILGIKKNMTQIFEENGAVRPVTIIEAGPVVVTQKKDKQKDGYDAVQVGYGEKKVKNINKAMRGHLKNLGNFRHLCEFRTDKNSKSDFNVGDKIEISSFEGIKSVNVSSISKGKGFQGVVKRHGFHGGPRTHGQKHSEREAGSIGTGGKEKVLKGTRMAGRMGGDKITVKNLKIIKINKDTNEIFVNGAVPGRKGTLVEIVSK